jgi:hypothetical protein
VSIDPLRYYIAEAFVAVLYYKKDNGNLKGFVIFSSKDVGEHVKSTADGLTLFVEGSEYPVDAEFYEEYGTFCESPSDLDKRAAEFRAT